MMLPLALGGNKTLSAADVLIRTVIAHHESSEPESLSKIGQFFKNKRDLPPTTRLIRPVKHRLTSWRLDPPSKATGPPVLAIAVRSPGRLPVRPVAHRQPLSGDISQTRPGRGGFYIPAFCPSLGKAGAQLSLSPVNAEYAAR